MKILKSYSLSKINYNFIVFMISEISAEVFFTSAFEYLIALSGSFKPLPVKIQTIFDHALTVSLTFISPVTEAADAGSANTPSQEAISL